MKPTPERKPALYDSNAYYAADGAASRLSPIFNPLFLFFDWLRVFGLLRVMKVKLGNALDVGAGDGKFLYFLKKRGFNVYGTTLSQTSQQAARQRFGVELQFADGLTGELSSRRYCLITYWHVFEHLSDPESHLAAWPALLDEDGVVVLEVPDPRALGASLCFDAWLGSDVLHHIHLVSEQDILSAARGRGFVCARIERFSLKFSYVFLWSGWLGRIFGSTYRFDGILDALKSPARTLRSRPGYASNLFASVLYLAPLVLISLLAGLWLKRGEVVRIYLKRGPAVDL